MVEKSGKKKGGTEAADKCLCPITKTYIVGSETVSQEKIDELVSQSEVATDVQAVTIGKSKATFKPLSKGKKLPKLTYKNIIEVYQMSNDLKSCVVRTEKKKAGLLVVLKFPSDDECKKFMHLVKRKNSKIIVVKEKSQDNQAVHDRQLILLEGPSNNASPSSPFPGDYVVKNSSISGEQRSPMSTISNNPKERTSAYLTNLRPYSQHIAVVETPKRGIATTKSAWSASFVSRGISPSFATSNLQPISKSSIDPVTVRSSGMLSTYQDTQKSAKENDCKHHGSSKTQNLRHRGSEEKMDHRVHRGDRKSFSLSSSQPFKLGLQKGPKMKNHATQTSVRMASSSNCANSHGTRRTKNAALRSHHDSLQRRRSSTSSSSSSSFSSSSYSSPSSNCRHGQAVMRKNYVGKTHKVSKRTSSVHSSDGSRKRKNSVSGSADRRRLDSEQASEQIQRRLMARGNPLRSSSVDLSTFSLVRISASRKSVTNLCSFGAPLLLSRTSLPRQVSSSTSYSNFSTSTGSDSESGISRFSANASEVTRSGRSVQPRHHEDHYKQLRSPSPQIRA